MTPRSRPFGYGMLLIAAGMIFGGLAVTLYAMGLSQAAVVPTIAAVAAAVVAVIKTGRTSDFGDADGQPAARGGIFIPAQSRSPLDVGADTDAPVASESEVPAR